MFWHVESFQLFMVQFGLMERLRPSLCFELCLKMIMKTFLKNSSGDVGFVGGIFQTWSVHVQNKARKYSALIHIYCHFQQKHLWKLELYTENPNLRNYFSRESRPGKLFHGFRVPIKCEYFYLKLPYPLIDRRVIIALLSNPANQRQELKEILLCDWIQPKVSQRLPKVE